MVNKQTVRSRVFFGIIALILILGTLFTSFSCTKESTTTTTATTTATKTTTTTATATTTATQTATATTTTTVSSEPIKIGVITSTSGFFAAFAPYMINGVQMVVDKINASGGLLGRPVEFIVKDDQADPSQIPQAAAALKAEGVVAIIGTFMDNCNAALLQWGNDNNMLIGLADDTVVENRTTKFSKYAFFQCPLAPINGELLAQYAVNQLNINSFYSLRGDVFISKQVADSFAAEVQKLKPSVVNLGETVTGTTETDFTTSISAILAKKPDLVLLGEGGPSFVPFVQQAQQFQFFDKVKVATYLMLGAENTVSLTTNFPTGLAITMTAPFWLDTPEMKAYTKDFYDRTKLYPGELTMDFFMATLALTEAIKKAGTTDTDKVIAAWETLKLTDTPLGTVSYNDYDHQADSPIWIGVSGYSSDYPDIAIGLNLTKYQEGIYPTKDEILALRNAK